MILNFADGVSATAHPYSNMRCQEREKACLIKGGPCEARHKQLVKNILRGHAVHVHERDRHSKIGILCKLMARVQG